MFTMLYECECGQEWEMTWECACDDRCPDCDVECTPSLVVDADIDDEPQCENCDGTDTVVDGFCCWCAAQELAELESQLGRL